MIFRSVGYGDRRSRSYTLLRRAPALLDESPEDHGTVSYNGLRLRAGDKATIRVLGKGLVYRVRNFAVGYRTFPAGDGPSQVLEDFLGRPSGECAPVRRPEYGPVAPVAAAGGGEV